MNESRDEVTGQLAENTDGLFGRAAELAAQGYTEMPDPAKRKGDEIGGDEKSLRAAAAELGAAGSAVEITTVSYTDNDGNPIADNEAVTPEKAAADLSASHQNHADALDILAQANVAEAVDDVRAQLLKDDPKAAEKYGFDAPTEEAIKDDGAAADENGQQPTSDQAEDESAELERLLQKPVISEALKAKFVEAETARTQHEQSLKAANSIAQAMLFEQFPEFAGLTAEQFPTALELTRQQDPAKFNRINAMLSRASQIQDQQQRIEKAREADIMKAFNNFATSEDARFEKEYFSKLPAARQAEVQKEIVASLQERGITPANFMSLYHSQPILRSAVMQEMMADAAQWRLAQRAKPTAAPKTVPPVQRPGVSGQRLTGRAADVSSIAAKFNTTGSVDDAVAFLQARRSARG